MNMARLGIWIDQETRQLRQRCGVNVFELYVSEMIANIGFPYVEINHAKDISTDRFDVLVAALPSDRLEDLERLWAYMEAGGVVISFAGLTALASRLGCIPDSGYAVGYAELDTAWHTQAPIRCFELRPWLYKKEMARSRIVEIGRLRSETPDGPVLGAVLQCFTVGQGRLERWAADVPGTVVKLQQGERPVVADGIPAPTGDAELIDYLLKADDECAMDWRWDRKTTPTGMNYYAEPYADYWQQAFAGRLLETVTNQGLVLPFVDYWPEGIDQVATISHDSDHNVDESAWITLELLKECGVNTTWCMIEPGYSKPVYDAIRQDGHELAFHYNALPKDHGFWDEQEFARQFAWLRDAIGGDHVKSNKNHYTLFKGWGELFTWCEKHGIECDQTRGPSKKGNVGFLFGTCHPYFPIAWVDEGNRLYDVVELHFLTQDLEHPTLADTSVVGPFLAGVQKVRGVAHFLFHQIHILQQPNVRQALRHVVSEAKKEGFVFWTGGQINDWYRARRSIRIKGIDGTGRVIVQSGLPAEHVSVWAPVLPGEDAEPQTKTRFGIPCRRMAVHMHLKVAEVSSVER